MAKAQDHAPDRPIDPDTDEVTDDPGRIAANLEDHPRKGRGASGLPDHSPVGEGSALMARALDDDPIDDPEDDVEIEDDEDLDEDLDEDELAAIDAADADDEGLEDDADDDETTPERLEEAHDR